MQSWFSQQHHRRGDTFAKPGVDPPQTKQNQVIKISFAPCHLEFPTSGSDGGNGCRVRPGVIATQAGIARPAMHWISPHPHPAHPLPGVPFLPSIQAHFYFIPSNFELDYILPWIVLQPTLMEASHLPAHPALPPRMLVSHLLTSLQSISPAMFCHCIKSPNLAYLP